MLGPVRGSDVAAGKRQAGRRGLCVAVDSRLSTEYMGNSPSFNEVMDTQSHRGPGSSSKYILCGLPPSTLHREPDAL